MDTSCNPKPGPLGQDSFFVFLQKGDYEHGCVAVKILYPKFYGIVVETLGIQWNIE
jgi:hypothetical protein